MRAIALGLPPNERAHVTPARASMTVQRGGAAAGGTVRPARREKQRPAGGAQVSSLTDSESDAQLVRRMRRGDADALTRWFHRNVDGVYGFAYYRVGRDGDLAADVTQETFARALAKLAAFDPERGTMIAWLCTLSRNCIRDVLRQRGRGQLAALWEVVDDSLRRVCDEIDRSPLGLEIVEARETRDLVAMTLTNLPETHRSVLEAKYMHGKSLRQIADERRTTVDAVKGLVKRARKAFKQTFVTLAGAVPYA